MTGERIDPLNSHGFSLIQHKDVFCLGTDSVLLADFAIVRRHERICDMGCGTGGIALLIACHADEEDPDKDILIHAVEIQECVADMAARSVAMNHMEDRIKVIHGDIREPSLFPGREMMTLCVCNPPYAKDGASLASDNAVRDAARRDTGLTPLEMCEAAFRLLKIRGRLCVVYPASRACELLLAMEHNRLAPKRLRLVQDKVTSSPVLILAEAVKLGGEGCVWMPNLILHDGSGKPTEELRKIYRDDRL